MLRKIRIQNYKSILDDTLELGRLNVFIGENGCGKTNILEALAMTSGALGGDLSADGLFNRGIRLARPSLTISAFANCVAAPAVEITLDGMADSLKLVSHGGPDFSANVTWEVESFLLSLVQIERDTKRILNAASELSPQANNQIAELRSTIFGFKDVLTPNQSNDFLALSMLV